MTTTQVGVADDVDVTRCNRLQQPAPAQQNTIENTRRTLVVAADDADVTRGNRNQQLALADTFTQQKYNIQNR